VACVLNLVGGGKTEGMDIEMASLFKMARRSGLWPQAQAPGRSALSKARAKIPWEAFREMLEKAVALAYEIWPERPGDRWHGMHVLAIDGSKFDLPATDEIREEFDPQSGLGVPGKGHYPQCLVSTLYDVFRALPLARTIAPYRGCERQEALKLLKWAPGESLIVFDRGYPSYEMFLHLEQNFSGHFLMRCKTTLASAVVAGFLKNSQREAIIDVPPPQSYSAQERRRLPTLRLRAVRTHEPDGKPIVFLTSLLDMEAIGYREIIDMYFKRWEVEVYYREEKVVQDIERFHSRSVQGISQEFFAVMVLTVISRTMAALSETLHEVPAGRSQRKHASLALAREAALLSPSSPRKALWVFKELLSEMARVRYYPPKRPRPPAPRISKAPRNKWATRARLSAAP
jgi:hypothetical protein